MTTNVDAAPGLFLRQTIDLEEGGELFGNTDTSRASAEE